MFKLIKFFFAQSFPVSRIRNFCIIAHIDHGKSTLADRFLEITNTIPRNMQSQYLDKLKVQKQRGITVKAQAVSMYYTYEENKYLINFVDTPGHVDFNYQVKRSMRSCQGALLIIDSTQGIQAQTLSNFELAKQQNLKILPLLNKIDMISANTEEVAQAVQQQLGLDKSLISYVSAKTGLNVQSVIHRIIKQIPPPIDTGQTKLKLFLVNSWFVKDKGVICLFQVKSGILKKNMNLTSCAQNKIFHVFQVGILNPQLTQCEVLTVGQIGYVLSNMKQVAEARIGDTFYKTGQKMPPQKGFQPAKPMVFAGIYPIDPDQYSSLQKNIYKLRLTDPAVTIFRQSSATLGNGFRCGFLGILHMDVFKQRLDDEYQIEAILTSPSVPYRCTLRNGKSFIIDTAINAPQKSQVKFYQQPMAKGTLIFPKEYIMDMKSLCENRRGKLLDQNLLQNKKYILKYRLPLAQIIIDFVDIIKSVTHGYGSFQYELDGYQQSNIQKLMIYIMNDPIDNLCFMVHKDRAYSFGKQICQKLKETIPSQLFVVTIQARLGSKIIAKQDIPYVKKNVTAKCYGGDYSRKKKLLDRYKQGKKKLRAIGKVQVNKQSFLHIMKY